MLLKDDGQKDRAVFMGRIEGEG